MRFYERVIKYFYIVIITFLTLTGFGQMPIFKRYRIADIPGLGWLAEFYITHAMHYIFASFLIALSVYLFFDHIFIGRKERKVTPTGYVKGVMILGLIITGGLMVFKNLSGILYYPIAISILDLSHLILCMALLFYSIFTLITAKRWTIK
ncbi:MAG: hypothetical protein HQK72_12300 [Desulfamplus sp.]|nr:hypothetical protein [Desulfamplus sp.]